MKKSFLYVLVLFFIYCKRGDTPAQEDLAMYFEKPQPINNSELSKIPSTFRGIFISKDSSYIEVKENVILKEYFNKIRIHKNESDSIKNAFTYLKDNKYLSKFDNEIYDYESKGDSIEFSNKTIDTLFLFSDKQKAKRIDGQLILNYKDSIYWHIKTINLEKNILKIKYIYSEEDLKRIDSLTKIKSVMIDSSAYILHSSRAEFKRIINLKKLGYEQEYKKIKK